MAGKVHPARYDAIVIGAGHNGLVAASILASHGLRVAVFEARDHVGGLASSPQLWPGFRVPIGAYVVSLFKRRLAARLGLLGKIRIYPKDPSMTVILEDGKHVRVWSDAEKTAREFSRFSAKDARSYPEWERYWSGVARLLDILYENPPLDPLELADTVRKASSVPLLGSRARRVASELEWLFTAPALRVLDEYFEAEESKTALLEDAIVGELASPSSPGTALVLAHHYMGDITGRRGQWAYVEGGMGRISEVLLDSCLGKGVDLYLGHSVDEIAVEGERVIGVVSRGKLYPSRVVVSTVNVKRVFLGMLEDPGVVDKGLLRRVKALTSIGASAKLVIARRGLPRLRSGYSGLGEDPYRSSLLVMKSTGYVESAYASALGRGVSEAPWISVNTQSFLDPTIAPEGYHVVSIFAQYVDSRKRRWGPEDEEEVSARIRMVAEEVFESLYGDKYRELVVTPRYIEENYGNPGGNIFHLNMTPDQVYHKRPLRELSSYRTPLKGLYISGASTHPGGGVTGLPGELAAQAVLEDLGIVEKRKTKLLELVKNVLKSM
ncbi:MAG: NAD(P)/FAD-dependent oxidoreductase [Desulfurococcales archaeon]|nr:NAD(P)/FAD-dependent oxidoreductase [Desulfurococcales archaeon]